MPFGQIKIGRFLVNLPHESNLSWLHSLVDRNNFSAPISANEDVTVAKVMDPKYYTD